MTPAETFWLRVQAEAARLISKEPLVAELILRLVPSAGSLSDTVARRLADLLHEPGIAQPMLMDLFTLVMSDNPRIEFAIALDLHAVQTRDPACPGSLHAVLNLKGFQALQAHRIAHALWQNERAELASWLSNRVSLVLGPDIHPAAQLGAGIMLDHGSGIVIGETVVVEDDVSILQNVTLGGTGKDLGARHPVIRRGVLIGAGAKILGRIEIGAFSKVAAGSVVLKDVPAHCSVAGIPAQIVRLHAQNVMPSVSMDQSF